MGIQRRVYQAFPQHVGAALDDLYEQFKAMYPHLPTIYWDTSVDEKFFHYVSRRKYFSLIVPYTVNRTILLREDISGGHLTWTPLGGSLRRDKLETFIDCALRHVSEALPPIALGEIEPIAFCRNSFSHGGAVHEHFGLSFTARLRCDAVQHRLDDLGSGTSLISIDDEIALNQPHNEDLLDLVRTRLNGLDHEALSEAEVTANERHRWRYRVHNRFGKKAFRMAGRHFFPNSVEDQDRLIMDRAVSGAHRRILDVGCGESSLVLDLSKLRETDLVVGNDIDWGQIGLLRETFENESHRKSGSIVVFTNHDARDLPFPDGFFDFVLCKNVLHHMIDAQSAKAMLREVTRVGKRGLVVDVMDPQEGTRWDRLVRKYYEVLLGDAGEGLLSRDVFEALTGLAERTSTFEMTTIRGTYLFAEFDRTALRSNQGAPGHPFGVEASGTFRHLTPRPASSMVLLEAGNPDPPAPRALSG